MATGKASDGSTGRKSWLYGTTLALALVGVLLIVGVPGAPGGPTTVGAGSAPAAPAPEAAGPNESRSVSSLDSSAEGGRFPSGYDTLGVSRGPDSARLVVREFADYQCPACGSFYPTTRKLEERYVETGRVRFVFFDFPITSAHPNAMAAAQAARCAGRQGAYWPMHDLLFEHQSRWADLRDPVPVFGAYAARAGADSARLALCVRRGVTRPEVERSFRFGRALGVRSTPTIVVGNTGVVGAIDWARLRPMIERRLAGRQP